MCDVFFCCCCVCLQTQIFKTADKQYEGEFSLLWKEAIWLIKTRTSTMCTLLDLTKIWKEPMRRRECCSIKGNNLIYISLYYSAIHQHMVFKRNVFYFKKIQGQIQRLAHKAKSLQRSVKQLPVVISIVLLSLCLDPPLTLHESPEGQQM